MILGIEPYMHIHELGILRLCIHEPGIQYLGLPRWGTKSFSFFFTRLKHRITSEESELAIAHN